MKNKKIVFIGMMGSGKSTIARELAKRLDFVFYDLDKIFEEKNNTSICDFFEKFGEKTFRAQEKQILNSILEKNSFVVSTGGGVILDEFNREKIFSKDIVSIFLKALPETIYDRIKNETHRPLLRVENPKAEIEKILNERSKYYSKAQVTIETDNKAVYEIVEEIIKKI